MHLEKSLVFSIFFKFAVIINLISGDAVDKPPDYITSLRHHYLALENDLWKLIESGTETGYVLTHIHIIHHTFLNENFHEFNVSLVDSEEDQSKLFDIFNEINLSASVLVNNYLHKSSSEFDEKKSVRAAQEQEILIKDLDKIYNLTGQTDFFKIIKAKAELKQCGDKQMIIKSANQEVYEYYHDISAAELKAYALVQLAYMIYTIYGRGDYRNTANALREKYRERTLVVQHHIKSILDNAKRETYKCDPNMWSIGAFEQVTNFLQGYIDNEVNLNPTNDCKKSCSDYNLADHYTCFNGTYCHQQPNEKERDMSICKGKIVDCQFIGSDLNICKSYDDTRRYNLLHYDNGRVFGKGGLDRYQICESTSYRVQSWTRWFVQCSNCFCYCDDRTNSERFFSLREVRSDIQKNKIVTGVALKKFQGIFHLMITERQLLGFGNVNTTMPMWSSWNTAGYFRVDDPHVRDGVDYHTLSWENRTINLDTVSVPDGKVVTGLRFRVIDGALTLQVRATEFDFTTGKLLNLDNSFWYASGAKERTEIILDQPDIPIEGRSKSIPYLGTNKFIKFGPTDLAKDAGQTTVPFIDAQLVESPNPTPLSGVGLYYKTFELSGGFIAPKLVNYNFAPHIVAPSINR